MFSYYAIVILILIPLVVFELVLQKYRKTSFLRTDDLRVPVMAMTLPHFGDKSDIL